MKKIVSIILCSVMSLSLLVGCGNDGSTTNEGTDSNNSSKTEKPVELNVMVWDRGNAAPGKTADNNTTIDFIKESMLEEHNIAVKYTPVPRSGSDDKVNVMMAGGNAPDIVMSYSKNLFGDYAKKGGLTDLTEYVEKFGNNLKVELDSILEVGQLDGKQYAIPSKRSMQRVKHVGYIRKDWVEALGKEIPTNKEELIEILYAFKEQDPGNVGADKVIPWAMGGNQDTEKYFLNFVGSFVDLSSEKDEYVYAAEMKSLAPDAKEGFKVLNGLYNDGIISKDFAVDTNDDKYKQDLVNGNVGFFVDDSMRAIDSKWLQTLMNNVPEAMFVPINAFESPNGKYVNPADPLNGMYIMVPSFNSDKAEAAVKYIDWLGNTENAMKVKFSPEYKTDENGIPLTISEQELKDKGYAGTTADLTITTQNWEFNKKKDSVVASWVMKFPEFDKGFFDNFYDQAKTGIYNEPVVQGVLQSEAKYYKNLKDLNIGLAYIVTSATKEDFEKRYEEEYNKLIEAGLQEVFDERANYYDEKVAK